MGPFGGGEATRSNEKSIELVAVDVWVIGAAVGVEMRCSKKVTSCKDTTSQGSSRDNLIYYFEFQH